MKRYAPDTNFYLQFKRPQELPWSELTEADTIELVVLHEVLNELDKHKNGGNERRARRSRDTLQLFRPLIIGPAEEIVVREKGPRVLYRLAPSLPTARTKPSTLDTSKADGRIIEEALACQATIGDITLLTHDSLPMLMARTHGLQITPLPDHWSLKPEPDPKDKEIARLNLEVNALQKRAPNVAVQVRVGGTEVERIEGPLQRYAQASNEFIEHAIEAVVRRHPMKNTGIAGHTAVYRADDWTAYIDERDQWAASLRGQLERYSNALNMENGLFPFELVLDNTGSESADDLVVEVFAEGHVRLVNIEAFDELKQKLKFTLKSPPHMPNLTDIFKHWNDTETLLHPYSLGTERFLQNLPGPPGRDFHWCFDDPEILSARLEGTCGDFRHKIHREEISLALYVPHDTVGAPEGRIRVRYSAKNLTNPVEKVWPVRVAYDWADTETAIAVLLRDQLDVEL